MTISKKTTVFLLFLLLIMTVALGSCADNSEQTPMPNKSDLKINSDKKLVFPMEQKKSFTVSITSGRDFQCAIKGGNDWLEPKDSIDTVYSKGADIPIQFHIIPNYSGKDRSAVILFRNSDKTNYTDTVYVTQSNILYINVKTAGTLSKEISDRKLDSLKVPSLVLTGELNGTDVLWLRKMAGGGKTISEKTEGQLTNLGISNIKFVKDDIAYFIDDKSKSHTIESALLLPNFMFAYCPKLETFSISSSKNPINQIGDYAFYNTSSLTSLNFTEGITDIGRYAFSGDKKLKSINLSKGIINIHTSAFNGCENLSHIKLPESVASIDSLAFYQCSSIDSIQISNNLKTLGFAVFKGCKSLQAISPISKNVTSIPAWAFSDCNALESVELSTNLTEIGASAFLNCSAITDITIPTGVKKIKEHTFDNCISLKSVKLPENLESIDAASFSRCSLLEDINLPNSLKSIGSSAFSNCNALKTIRIPDNITEISDHTFENCTSLKNITFPEILKTIGAYSFNKCSALKAITIPQYVTLIDAYAFQDCNTLTSVTINVLNPLNPKVVLGVLCFNPGNATLYVPKNTIKIYVKSIFDTYFRNRMVEQN